MLSLDLDGLAPDFRTAILKREGHENAFAVGWPVAVGRRTGVAAIYPVGFLTGWWRRRDDRLEIRISADNVLVNPDWVKGRHRLSGGYGGCVRLPEPHGSLLSTRRDLVAREVAGDGRMQHFGLDRTTKAALQADSFRRDPDFVLTHTARAFGSYHDDREYGPIVWLFSTTAAPVARALIFHLEKTLTDAAEGTLTVRFHASGKL
ncbi:MAG: hypothetical protein ABI832_20015 [bacterium]